MCIRDSHYSYKTSNDATVTDLSGSHYDLSNNYYVNKIANDNNIAILDTSVNQLEGTTATNTSDISTLNTNLTTKAPIASPSFTGVPTAPTASSETNTTQIATTAFVQSTVANLVDSAPEALSLIHI